MGEGIIDSIGNFFGIGVTDNERKRSKYNKLYHQIQDDVDQLEEYLSEIKWRMETYTKADTIPKNKIPGIEFSDSRTSLDDRLTDKINKMKDELDEAKAARRQAKRAYNHYKYLAAKEDE